MSTKTVGNTVGAEIYGGDSVCSLPAYAMVFNVVVSFNASEGQLVVSNYNGVFIRARFPANPFPPPQPVQREVVPVVVMLEKTWIWNV